MTKKIFILAGIAIVAGGAYLALTDVRSPFSVERPQACTMEAKICPDGSAVGRTGPNCEFAACPGETPGGNTVVSGTKVVVTTRIGQNVEALGETIVPVRVLDDSRCPLDVQCVWAGTVRVEASVLGGMDTGQITFELGKTGTTEVNSITLIDVQPAAMSGATIEPGDYVLTFEVVRR